MHLTFREVLNRRPPSVCVCVCMHARDMATLLLQDHKAYPGHGCTCVCTSMVNTHVCQRRLSQYGVYWPGLCTEIRTVIPLFSFRIKENSFRVLLNTFLDI